MVRVSAQREGAFFADVPERLSRLLALVGTTLRVPLDHRGKRALLDLFLFVGSLLFLYIFLLTIRV